jgi:hypothetical protein
VSYLLENATRFGIPNTVIEPLQVEVELFRAAQVKAEEANAGKADRLDRNEKALAVSKVVRDFVNVNLRYNKNVTDADRINLGLTVPDTSPTTPRDPDTQPVVKKIDSSIIMRLGLHYFLNKEDMDKLFFAIESVCRRTEDQRQVEPGEAGL